MSQYQLMDGVGHNNNSGEASISSSNASTAILPSLSTSRSLSNGASYCDDTLYAIHDEISNLNLSINKIFGELQQFRTEYEAFHVAYNAHNQHTAVTGSHTDDLEMQQRYMSVSSKRNTMLHDLRSIILKYDSMQSTVIIELRNWQRNQALAANGAMFRDNLDDIQRCIELLIEMIGKILDIVNMLQTMPLDTNNGLSELTAHARNAQQLLILSSFIVEKQPPQVMKKKTKFVAAVRWLIGPQLGISANSPSVECIIMSESQAQRHSAQRNMSEVTAPNLSTSGDLENNTTVMDYDNQTRIFSGTFRTLQLWDIKRPERKGSESVTDEKFTLLFHTSAIVNDYRIKVWTLSLPVVVTVHGTQEPQAWATITWDNAFSNIVREPFQVPERVVWSQIALALNTKFESITGRPLTDDNLNFIYEKLFPLKNAGGEHKEYVTWAQFCKEKLPERSFTFWEWFFAIMKLTKEHCQSIWKAGSIVGFISKLKADEILRQSPMGTFLLRFSDSELGGITLALTNEQNSVLMLSPWTPRDLSIRGLADRIHDIPLLLRVYPSNRSRDDAFGEFYTQRPNNTISADGYVSNTIIAFVPAIESAMGTVGPQYEIQSSQRQDVHMVNIAQNDVSPVDDYNGANLTFSDLDWGNY
ncbi:signal transducer and transcription activator-like isoform 1-T3 [Glossina fuscipes fuscipes]